MTARTGRTRPGRLLRLAALATTMGAGWLMIVPTAAAARPAAQVAAAQPAAPAHPWIAITSMNPTIAGPKTKITISVIVANPTATPLTGASVQLWSSGFALAGRPSMTSYLASQGPASVQAPQAGPQAPVPSPVPPHGIQTLSLTWDVSQTGMHAFGVYPLAAQLTSAGTELDVARTFLPFWPGKSELRTLKPLPFGWVWPLIDTPQRAACPGLLSNELAASVSHGRLAGLLAAGQSTDGHAAMLTWAIDPALLSDVAAMTKPYRTGGTGCAGKTPERASRAAAAWLAGVKAVTGHQDFFVTPYADVDIAALAHKGMDSELSAAFTDGRAWAHTILGGSQRATPGSIGQLAWPAGGMADYTAIEDAAHHQVTAMILDSKVMPPLASLSYTPTAVTTTPDGIGTRMNVLLSDHSLTEILSQRRSQIPGVTPGPTAMPPAARAQILQAAAFGKEQWFLAETAMIAAETAPGAARAVVAAPPRRWNPALGVARALLAATDRAPWLSPATLASIAAGGSGPGKRLPPPPHRMSGGQLGGSLLRQVRKLNDQVQLLDSILTSGGRGYLSTAVDAAESSAWRGGRVSQRPAIQLLRRSLAFVEAQLRGVRIIDSGRVTLGGKQGDVPVSVRNNLGREVTVLLQVHAPRGEGVSVGQYNKRIQVPGKSQVTVKIPVQATAAGSTALAMHLTSVGGVALPGHTPPLTVTATHFGTLAIVIISVALVVFVLTAAARAFRRGSGPAEGDAEPDATEPGPMTSPGDPASAAEEPGSVGTGSADEGHPARENDEHATAPGRADRR